MNGSRSMSRGGEQRAHTIVVLAENKDGLLARISSLLCARGYALECLTVGTSHDPTIARLTTASSPMSAPPGPVPLPMKRLLTTALPDAWK